MEEGKRQKERCIFKLIYTTSFIIFPIVLGNTCWPRYIQIACCWFHLLLTGFLLWRISATVCPHFSMIFKPYFSVCFTKRKWEFWDSLVKGPADRRLKESTGSFVCLFVFSRTPRSDRTTNVELWIHLRILLHRGLLLIRPSFPILMSFYGQNPFAVLHMHFAAL